MHKVLFSTWFYEFKLRLVDCGLVINASLCKGDIEISSYSLGPEFRRDLEGEKTKKGIREREGACRRQRIMVAVKREAFSRNWILMTSKLLYISQL
jgi:hypothetical protein